MLGGDPSILTLIAFNEPNATEEEAQQTPWKMKTGIEQALDVRQYVSIYDKPYITFNETWFDGEKINW